MSHPDTQVRRVYDPLLRTLHWSLALSILALVVTSQLAEAFENGPWEDTIWNLQRRRIHSRGSRTALWLRAVALAAE